MIQYVITSRDGDPLFPGEGFNRCAPVRAGFDPCDELHRGFDGTIVYESTCELGAGLCGSDERFFDFLGSNELQERGDAVLGPLDTTLDGRHDVGR